jgi:hypothetical protein
MKVTELTDPNDGLRGDLLAEVRQLFSCSHVVEVPPASKSGCVMRPRIPLGTLGRFGPRPHGTAHVDQRRHGSPEFPRRLGLVLGCKRFDIEYDHGRADRVAGSHQCLIRSHGVAGTLKFAEVGLPLLAIQPAEPIKAALLADERLPEQR